MVLVLTRMSLKCSPIRATQQAGEIESVDPNRVSQCTYDREMYGVG